MRKVLLSLVAAMMLAPVAALAQQMPVRVGGNIQAPERTIYVPPVYPEAARAANVTGVVIVEAVIAADGTISSAKAIRSIPLLDQAALDAVRQWRYQPTSLNGNPVPVIMTVTVNFTAPRESGEAPMMASGMQPSYTAAASSDPIEVNGRQAVRIGGEIAAPERTKYFAPVYPADMLAARVQGVVIMQAVIDEAGKVVQTKVLRSIAGLDQAAIDAVARWEYAPTMLNGIAVPVVLTVTVNFTLQ